MKKNRKYVMTQESSLGKGANIVVIIFFTLIMVLAFMPVLLVFMVSLTSEKNIASRCCQPIFYCRSNNYKILQMVYLYHQRGIIA